MKQMILEIAAGAEFDDMPEELQAAIQKAKIQWPESIMLGTEPVNGMQLIFVMCGVSADELEFLMNNDEFDDEGNQIAFNLGWSVLAVEGEPVDQSLLLPYFSEVPVIDEEGNITGTEPVTDLTGKIQTWAGRKWEY